MISLKKNENLLPVLALLLVQLIFGFNFAATKAILVEYPPVLWGGIRLLIAAVLMFTAAYFVVPKAERRTDKSFLGHCFLYGMIGIAANQAFFMMGLKYTTITNAAILNTLTPIFTLLFAIIAGSEKLTRSRAFGFLLAVVGAIVIRRFEDFQLSSDTFKGDLFTVINCASLALFFVISRNFLKQNSPFWATAWMFLFGGVVLMAISVHDFSRIFPAHTSGTLYFAIFYNVVLATMVTYFLNAWTLTKVKPSSVAIFIYFQPVIAVLNAWFTGGEIPNLRVMVAMTLIFSGVAVGVIKKA
jgi:drug/metabolite transporter (DMT)-like permease